jgi:serine/threonine protein kinase
MDSERDDPTKPVNDATTPIERVSTKVDPAQFEVTVSAVPLFNDRYLIEKELGRGGIGITYLARDNQLYGMSVVIKVLIEKPGNKEWVKRKFIQESEALTRISHPGVVKVLNRGEFDGGKPFFVMAMPCMQRTRKKSFTATSNLKTSCCKISVVAKKR